MNAHDAIERHYAPTDGLADRIAARFREIGKSISELTTTDLAMVDEFHIRGRPATVELAGLLDVGPGAQVLDIGSGLGGPARTVAETLGCRVDGIDLTAAFCEAATELTQWVGMGHRVRFTHGDAMNLPYEAETFDAAMTLHVGMNIAAKTELYVGVRRVMKPGAVFAIYDVLQGEGGDVIYPTPWARDPSISHVATPAHMRRALTDAGFAIFDEIDSTEASEAWFETVAQRMAESGPPPISFRTFLGDDFQQMTVNQVRNLKERRIRTVTYLCRC